MTKEFLRMARAQAATTAFRETLDIVRRHPAKEAEHRLLEKIAGKKPALDRWRRLQEEKKRWPGPAETARPSRSPERSKTLERSASQALQAPR